MASKKYKIVRAAMGIREGILDGRPSDNCCYMVCAAVQGWVGFAYNIDLALIEGELQCKGHTYEHFWLELRDGTIIDPTADQFIELNGKKMPPVYYGPKPDWYMVANPK